MKVVSSVINNISDCFFFPFSVLTLLCIKIATLKYYPMFWLEKHKSCILRSRFVIYSTVFFNQKFLEGRLVVTTLANDGLACLLVWPICNIVPH